MTIARIAIAQSNSTVGDIDGNTKKIISLIRKAERNHADFVVFPELAITGYPPKDLLLKPSFIIENKEKLDAIVQTTGNVCAIVGFVDSEERKLSNAAAVIYNNKIVGVYRKRKLPNYDVFDEKRYFAEGRENSVFTVNGRTFGVVICEDVFTKNTIIARQKKAGASFIFVISASPFSVGKIALRDKLIGLKAQRSRLPIVYVNLVGGQDDLVFDGNSTVFDASGNVVARAKHCAEDMLFTTLGDAAGTPSAKQSALRNEIADMHDAIILGLRDYVRKNGFKTVTLGLSGGIDSALTAVLASRAVGPRNVVGVAMPSAISSKESLEDARDVATNLGIEFKVIPIKEIVKEYEAALAMEFKGAPPDTTEENLQARVRGNVLMALSNKFGHLVLSTGNKSEIATGYSTLYGDMAGGLAVISDVPKTAVYELARYINATAKTALIPQRVIDKEPTAELRIGQKDSDTLPPYEILDKILHLYVEEDKSKEEIIVAGFDATTVTDVIQRVDHSEYKRKQAPTGIKITSKAFGFGRRMPITNKYKG